MNRHRHLARAALLAASAAIALAAAPAGAAQSSPPLQWTDCDDGLQCATATVPLSYASPRAGTTTIALVRHPATGAPEDRLGSLFINPGGPGGSGTEFVRLTFDSLLARLNERYDVVGFDPRGTGDSGGALDCAVNQETDGLYRIPFARPTTSPAALLRKDAAYVSRCLERNRAMIPYVTTGNVARDLDQLRGLVGDPRLNYLGFSYGTFIGATYGAMFPGRLGRVVLDGPVNASGYVRTPSRDLDVQTSGFEESLGRFLDACKADQVACAGFGGDDPRGAFDALLRRADREPLSADSYPDDPRPVDGDTIRWATSGLLYAKFLWPYLAQELAAAEQGDGGPLRAEADASWGLQPDGSYDPGTDRYFLIGAIDQVYGYPHHALAPYLIAGARSYRSHPYYWYNNGYVELNYGLFGARPDGLFAGPFRIPARAATPLVVATTHDPATPYSGALSLTRDLGNARLVTMDGDNHTAYGGNSPCIDDAVEGYLFAGTLPPAGLTCEQDVPFEQPEALAGVASGSGTQRARARAATLAAATAAAQPAGPVTKPVDPAPGR